MRGEKKTTTKVEKDSIENQSITASQVQPKHTLFIEGLDYWTRNEELYQLFGNTELLENITIPLDYFKRRGRGFAFVSVKNRITGDDLIERFNNTTFKDRVIRIRWSRD